MKCRGRPHVVCFPFPMQGHIAPMMQLATFLASEGFAVTVVHTHHNLQRLQLTCGDHQVTCSGGGGKSPCSSLNTTSSSTCDSIPSCTCADQQAAAGSADIQQHLTYIGISDGLRDEMRDVSHAVEQMLASECSEMVHSFNALMDKLAIASIRNHDQHVLRATPTCIISDAILSWTHHTAQRLCIPRVALWTNCLSSWPAFGNIPLLFERGFMPYHDDAPKDPIDCLPCLPPIYCLTDLPHLFRIPDLNHPLLQFIMRQMELCRQADWILCNTLEALEGQVIDAISKDTPILPVGPLLASFEGEANKPMAASTSKDEDQCLEWLNAQDPSSVLFVSFGSLAYLPAAKIEQIALGLEESGVPFLWAFRQDFVEGKSENFGLLNELIERLSPKGLVVPWVPQIKVLAHDSVGGFLTHCGWNSILESVHMGVPMLGWPVESEQKMNCKMMVEQWKVGWEIKIHETNSIKEDIARLVRVLMMSEEGHHARYNVQNLSQATRETMSHEGRSRKNLQSIVHHLLQRHAKETPNDQRKVEIHTNHNRGVENAKSLDV